MRNAIFLVVACAFFLSGCTEDVSGPDSGGSAYIRILEPKTGAQVRLGEKFMIITESDYDKFGQKLSYAATTDSGMTWAAFIISLEPRTGMKIRDTVTCSFDSLGFAAGQKTKIRVIEYGKVHFATSEFIEIVP